MYLTITLYLHMLLYASPPTAYDQNSLEIPQEIAPQVAFWQRVYTEQDSKHGFIHDATHLDVIYEVIELPWIATINKVERRKFIQSITTPIKQSLLRLATGKRRNLLPRDADILAKWPDDVSNQTLQQAANQIRFQSGGRDAFLAGMIRSRAWMPYIVQTFQKYNLPSELAALPYVESSFDINAYSKAHAAGIWQFTAATAKRFMTINHLVDERYDPLRSTEAAAALLQENYQAIGTWPLAITAYNHGTHGIKKAIQATGSRDIAYIIGHYKHRNFGFASRNFYTELLAAWEVSQHAEQYFGPLPLDNNTNYKTIVTDGFYQANQLAQSLGVDIDTLKTHNPALRPIVWSKDIPIPQGLHIRFPHKDILHEDIQAVAQ